MANIELKPCPFCGGSARMRKVMRVNGKPPYYEVLCDDTTERHCGVAPLSDKYADAESAAAAWNRRAT